MAIAVVQLPEDLIFHILSELPVKSLLVFKSVCKSWRYNMINTPYFIKTHLVRSSTKTKSTGGSSEYSSQFVVVENYTNVDGHRLISELYILNCSKHHGPATVPSSSSLSPIILPNYHIGRCSPQTCHGLITFTAYPAISDSSKEYRIVVMNPATREFHRLPLFSELVGFPGSSNILFDPSSCSYKVLWVSDQRQHGIRNSCAHSYQIINLGGGGGVSWRKVIVPDDLGMNDCWVFPDSLNGISYHFPSAKGYHSRRSLDQISLLFFDVEKENFLACNIAGLDGFTGTMGPIYPELAAFRGSIYAFFICKSTPKVLHVWVMKDCMAMSNKYWIKENSCDYNLYELDFLWGIDIVAVTNNGFVMQIFGLLKNGADLMACAIYDPIKKVLRKSPIADQILKYYGEREYPICGDYVESLVSPKHGYK